MLQKGAEKFEVSLSHGGIKSLSGTPRKALFPGHPLASGLKLVTCQQRHYDVVVHASFSTQTLQCGYHAIMQIHGAAKIFNSVYLPCSIDKGYRHI